MATARRLSVIWEFFTEINDYDTDSHGDTHIKCNLCGKIVAKRSKQGNQRNYSIIYIKRHLQKFHKAEFEVAEASHNLEQINFV